jgi:hypothetical protein
MNTDKTILVDLIVEDLCLQQLLIGMENIGLKSQYEPSIQHAIAALMGINTDEMFDEWFDKYNPIYEKALLLKYQDKKSLRILAEAFIIYLDGVIIQEGLLLSNE